LQIAFKKKKKIDWKNNYSVNRALVLYLKDKWQLIIAVEVFEMVIQEMLT